MTAPLISELPLWERHEQRVLAILRSALDRFRANSPQGNELTLNRELYLCILEINHKNKAAGDDSWFDYPPVFEGRNPPTPGTEDSASERKIPDLQWGYIDHQADHPRDSVRNFTIECKRLGAPSCSGWKFNVHYVQDGIRRFVDLESRYGKDVASGAMVGYIESLTPAKIAVTVNNELNTLNLPTLVLSQGTRPLTEMEHSFGRPFELSPFRLIHLWIDVR